MKIKGENNINKVRMFKRFSLANIISCQLDSQWSDRGGIGYVVESLFYISIGYIWSLYVKVMTFFAQNKSNSISLLSLKRPIFLFIKGF